MMLLMRWWCWCADSADAPMLLMRWCCWCTDATDALMLLMRWCSRTFGQVWFYWHELCFCGSKVRGEGEGFLKKLCFNCFSFHVSCHNCNPKLLQPFQLLEYQMDRGGGQIWYSREMDLCPPCTEAHPPWRVGLPPGGWAIEDSPTGGGGRILPTRWVSFQMLIAPLLVFMFIFCCNLFTISDCIFSECI